MNCQTGGSVLLIVKRDEKIIDEISNFLQTTGCEMVIDHNLGSAITSAQLDRYDVIVLDAGIECVPIEQTLQIFREIDPNSKIIVKTNSNSKELEAKIRREKIYYYHIDSFGSEDLKLAIKSAVKQVIQNRGVKPIIREIGRQKRLILMIDENDDFIEIHKANLENHNFNVDICFDPDKACETLKTCQPDLIMVDLDIPVGSDGLHFMDKYLAYAECKDYPVLLFTSKSLSEDLEKIMVRVRSTLPTWTYLEKPVKIEDIIPVVKNLLSQQNRQKNG